VEVVLENPEQMNLLGLFMKAALEARGEAIASAKPSGTIALTGGEMSVTLDFAPGKVTISKGADPGARAHLKGPLEPLVQVARGKSGPILKRQVKLSGNPLAALPLNKVFRAG
jgi:SCP-2 sterol transfer family